LDDSIVVAVLKDPVDDEDICPMAFGEEVTLEVGQPVWAVGYQPDGVRKIVEAAVSTPRVAGSEEFFHVRPEVTDYGDCGSPALALVPWDGRLVMAIVGVLRSGWVGATYSESSYMHTAYRATWLRDIIETEMSADRDGDGVPDREDSCCTIANPGQLSDPEDDIDLDGFGRSCDICPEVRNLDQVSIDTDEDGYVDCNDNCSEISNPYQANCDWADDEEENVPLGLRGDVCDPDPCLAIRGDHLVTDEIEWIDMVLPDVWRARRRIGNVVRFDMEALGGTPDYSGENPAFAADTWDGSVRMAHCQCDPNDPLHPSGCEVAYRDCQRFGEYGYIEGTTAGWWHDSPWDREDYYPYPPYAVQTGPAGSDIEEVTFARPIGYNWAYENGDNLETFGLRWTEASETLQEGDFVTVWQRPVEPGSGGGRPFDWADDKGNTYYPAAGEGLMELETSYRTDVWVPPWFDKLISPPP